MEFSTQYQRLQTWAWDLRVSGIFRGTRLGRSNVHQRVEIDILAQDERGESSSLLPLDLSGADAVDNAVVDHAAALAERPAFLLQI